MVSTPPADKRHVTGHKLARTHTHFPSPSPISPSPVPPITPSLIFRHTPSTPHPHPPSQNLLAAERLVHMSHATLNQLFPDSDPMHAQHSCHFPVFLIPGWLSSLAWPRITPSALFFGTSAVLTTSRSPGKHGVFFLQTANQPQILLFLMF